MIRTLRSQLFATRVDVTATSPLPLSLVRHDGWLLSHNAVGRDGLACHQRSNGRPCRSEILNFIDMCSKGKSQAAGGAYAKLDNAWSHRVWLGRTDQSGENTIGTPTSLESLDGVTTARGPRTFLSSEGSRSLDFPGTRRGHKRYPCQLDCSLEVPWCLSGECTCTVPELLIDVQQYVSTAI